MVEILRVEVKCLTLSVYANQQIVNLDKHINSLFIILFDFGLKLYFDFVNYVIRKK
jgi:hypothetical protein